MTCAHCGSSFTTNQPQQRYCSRACYVHAKRKRQLPRQTKRRRDSGYNAAKLRARHRKRNLGKAVTVPYAQCIVCRALYLHRRVRQPNHCRRPNLIATCHPARKHYAGGKCQSCYRNRPPRPVVPCERCGDLLVQTVGHHKMHAECARASRKERERDRRRALEADAFVEHVDRWRVYERDGWICQLCHEPVPRGYSVPHPLAPTIDHIIPMGGGHGGTHEYANVQLAHFECNWRKRDQIGWTWTEPEERAAA